MTELLGLEKRLRKVSLGRQIAQALYLYSNPAYSTIYGIINLYKNYPTRLRISAQDQFKKIIVQLQIEIKYGFAIHHKLWT